MARGAGEQNAAAVPRDIPVLAVAVRQLRGLAGHQVGDEHVRGRIDRVAAAVGAVAQPRGALRRDGGPCLRVRHACRVGDARPVRRPYRRRGRARVPRRYRAADAQRVVGQLAYRAACRPHDEQLSPPLRVEPQERDRRAIRRPARRAIAVTVGQARRRRRTVGRGHEDLGAIARTVDPGDREGDTRRVRRQRDRAGCPDLADIFRLHRPLRMTRPVPPRASASAWR